MCFSLRVLSFVIVWAVGATTLAAQTLVLSDLSRDALIDIASVENAAFATVEERISELRERVGDAEGEIDEKILAIQALVLPDQPSTDDFGPSVENAQATVAAWNKRIELLERSAELVASLQVQVEARVDLYLLMAQEAELRATWARKNLPIREELLRRQDQGDISVDEIPDVFQRSSEEVGDGSDLWRQRAQRDRLLILANETRNNALEQSLAEDRLALERAEAQLISAVIDNNLELEFVELSEADLSVAYTETQLALVALREADKQRRAAFEAASGDLLAAEFRLEGFGNSDPAAANQPSEIDGAGLEVGLRTAEIAIENAQMRAALEEDRLDLMRAVYASSQALSNARTDYASSVEALIERLAPSVVLAELANFDEASIARQELSEKRAVFFDLRRSERDILQKENQYGVDVKASRTALQEAVASVTEREAALEQEKVWVQFQQRAAGLDNDGLLRAYDTALNRLQSENENRGLIERIAEQSLRKIEAITEEFSQLRNPIGTETAQNLEAFALWRGTVGLASELQFNDDTRADEDAPGPEAIEETSSDLNPNANTASRGYGAILDQARQDRDQIAERIIYFQGLEELQAGFVASVEAAIDAQAARVEQQELLLSATRETWGAATVIRERGNQQRIDRTRVPDSIADWADREKVIDVMETLGEARVMLDLLEQRRSEKLAPVSGANLTTAMRQGSKKFETQIEALVSLTSFSEQYASLATMESLDDLNQSIIAREVTQRFEGSQGLQGFFDGIVESHQLSDVDELLNRYFERLVLLEHRTKNLNNQEAQMGLVRSALAEQRPILETLAERVSESAEVAGTVLIVKTATLRAALEPERASEFLDTAEMQVGIRPLPQDIPEISVDPEEENSVDALATLREENIGALVTHWSIAEGYKNWANDLTSALTPYGEFDDRTADLNELSLQISTQISEINKRIQRLTGLQIKEDSANAGEELATQKRFIAGEIGDLQTDRSDIIERFALRSGLALIVIPVLAVAIYFVGLFLGNRFFRRAAERSTANETSDDRFRRTETLSDIFRTAWRGIVFLLTIIYMLGAVNFDITPIIASLGVLGLAVAFGAQTIMRDLFSGFFLLMENQLNKGDLVEINGIYGTVEQIGLRITTLRAKENGLLHYFPNGTITDVANENRQWWCGPVLIKVPYSADFQLTAEIMREELNKLAQDPAYSSSIQTAYIEYDGPIDIDYDVGGLVYRAVFELTGSGRPIAIFRERVIERLHAAGIELAMPVEASFPDKIFPATNSGETRQSVKTTAVNPDRGGSGDAIA